MLNFKVDEKTCTKCGLCVKDCPAVIIKMEDGGLPFIKAEDETKCYKCQHCLAVCPTASISILGVKPEDCIPAGEKPSPDKVEALIRNRRTVRSYKDENVDPEKLSYLFKVAANAPTGKNDRQTTLHVIDNKEEMNKFREKVYSTIEKMDSEGKLTGEYSFFGTVAKMYRGGNDIVFRGAPHLVVSSAPKTAASPVADGFIVLSYIELMASSMGLGTVWLGFLMYIFSFAPELKKELNIPEDHDISYPMLIGEPSVKHQRGVVRDDIDIRKITF